MVQTSGDFPCPQVPPQVYHDSGIQKQEECVRWFLGWEQHCFTALLHLWLCSESHLPHWIQVLIESSIKVLSSVLGVGTGLQLDS